MWFFHKLSRASEDLDFTAVGEVDTDGIADVLMDDLSAYGVKAVRRDEEGHVSFTTRLALEGPIFDGINPNFIRLEVSLRSDLAKGPVFASFRSPYTDVPNFTVLGMDPVVPLLDLIVAQCGDCHMERVADLFEYFKLPTARLGVPSDWEKTLPAQYYHKGLVRIKQQLEEITGNRISDQKLRESIDAVNGIRGLLRKINLLRKEQPPPIGGYDFITKSVAHKNL